MKYPTLSLTTVGLNQILSLNKYIIVTKTILDRTLRVLTQQPNLPFGGKIVVLGGDFRQCLPVVPRAQPEEIVNTTLNNIDFWPQVTILRLRENI